MKSRVVVAMMLAIASLSAIPATADAAVTGSISGTVTEGTVPAAEVYVDIIGIVDNGFYGKGPSWVDGTITDESGHYTVPGLPASGTRGYWVCFTPSDWPSGRYESECYDQTSTYYPFPSGAGFLDPAPGSKAVPLIAGQHRVGVDADLQPMLDGATGGITGKVNAFGLLPVRHAKVTVDSAGTPAGATFSNGSGVYRVTGLAPGAYRMCFDGSTAAGNYRKICRKELVAVRAGVVTKGVNGVLTT